MKTTTVKNVLNAALTIASILITASLFLPFFNVRVYDVYLYDLSRTEIQSQTMTLFDVAFKNDFFGSKPLLLLYLVFPVLVTFLSVLYTQKRQTKAGIFLAVVSVVGFIAVAALNTIFSKYLDILAFDYVDNIIEQYPNFPIIELSANHAEAYWIDLAYGSFVSCVSYAIIVFVVLCQLVFAGDRRAIVYKLDPITRSPK